VVGITSLNIRVRLAVYFSVWIHEIVQRIALLLRGKHHDQDDEALFLALARGEFTISGVQNKALRARFRQYSSGHGGAGVSPCEPIFLPLDIQVTLRQTVCGRSSREKPVRPAP
jgi:hypothetical protein